VAHTAGALLGARAGCRLFHPEQIRIPEPEMQVSGETVALHFVGPVRALLADWAGRPMADSSPVPIGRVPAGRCVALDQALTEVRRRLSRLSA
jgi:hypothetical protein